MDFSSRNKVKAEWGMASMTDLIFLLLIFFIIMSLMSNNQTPSDLPEAKEDIKPVTDPVEATVIITEDNRYVVMPGGKMEEPMEFEQIKELTAAAVANTNKMPTTRIGATPSTKNVPPTFVRRRLRSVRVVHRWAASILNWTILWPVNIPVITQ